MTASTTSRGRRRLHRDLLAGFERCTDAAVARDDRVDGRRDRPRALRRNRVRPSRGSRAHVDHRLLRRRSARPGGRLGARLWEDTKPFASGGVYVNALDADRPVAGRLRRRRLGAARDGQAPLRPGRRLRAATASARLDARALRARRARPPRRGCARRACQHAADVVLGRLWRDHEALGDLGVREAGGDQVSTSRSRAVSSSRSPRARRAARGSELAQQRRRPSASRRAPRRSKASRAARAAASGERRARRGLRPREPSRARASSSGNRACAKPRRSSHACGGGRPGVAARDGDTTGAPRRLRRAGRLAPAAAPPRRGAARQRGRRRPGRPPRAPPLARDRSRSSAASPPRRRARAAPAQLRVAARRCSSTSAGSATVSSSGLRAGARPLPSAPAAAAGRPVRRAAGPGRARAGVLLALERLCQHCSARAHSPERTSTLRRSRDTTTAAG